MALAPVAGGLLNIKVTGAHKPQEAPTHFFVMSSGQDVQLIQLGNWPLKAFIFISVKFYEAYTFYA